LVLVSGAALLVTLMKFSSAAGLAPARLMASGHADTQPRAPNDTAANRAMNRRVDSTFANGRDQPGSWQGLPAADTTR
jgi:flagellar motor protein MotB